MDARISRRSFVKLSLAALVSVSAPVSAFLSACSRSTRVPFADTTPRVYGADDPDILYTGRIDFTDAAQPRFSAPGVCIRARFRGTAAAVMLADEFKWGTNRNYYDVLIDDTTVVKLAPEQSVTRYEVAAGLPNGEHTINVVKRTEASIGACTFQGFEFAGQILPAPERPGRRIEFIGDSITCGAGNEARVDSDQCAEDGWGQPYNNVRLSYGPVLAGSLGAECHVSAVSGIGLIRNYSSQYDARPMPEVYDLLFFERTDSPAWDSSRYVPDVVVIALGTNDFSPGDSDRPIMEVDAWAAACTRFIDRLRGYYPDATIFCASSPMLGDNWPTSAYKSATDQKTAIAKVVKAFNESGDARIYQFFASPIVGMGCGTHPNVSQHATMASQLGSFIASVMGW